MDWLLGSENMRRYWIEKSQINGSQVNFKNDLFHHIFDVCRQEVGHHFEVLTEDSKAYLVKVLSIEKKQAFAEIMEERLIEKLPLPHIHLALSIPRFTVMDSIVERAVEMGVSSILPFYSDYSFIRKSTNMPEGKKDRWNKIVRSATQQCGRGELMKIHNPCDWNELIKMINPGEDSWCLFAYEGAAVSSPNQYLKTKKATFNNSPKDIWVLIGSEGGFSAQEVTQMQQLGLDPVTLGSQILRVETACLTLVSVLKYEFGLLK